MTPTKKKGVLFDTGLMEEMSVINNVSQMLVKVSEMAIYTDNTPTLAMFLLGIIINLCNIMDLIFPKITEDIMDPGKFVFGNMFFCVCQNNIYYDPR